MSGASLDRLQIELRQRGRQLFDKQPSKGGVVAMHADAIDSFLNEIDGMQEARQAFKTRADQVRAMNDVRSVLTEPTETFSAKVPGMTPEAKQAAQVQVRQALENAFGRRSRAVLDGITNVAESPAIKANLTELFGPEEAGRMVKFAQLKLKEFKTAQQIAPSTGSQSFGRASEEGVNPAELVAALKTGGGALLTKLLRSGVTMTMAERDHLARLGLTEDLPKVLEQVLAEKPRATPSRPIPYRRLTPPVAAAVGANQP